MSPSFLIRLCALIAFLISATFVQTTIIDIPYTDERVSVTPKTDWYVGQPFLDFRKTKFSSEPPRSYLTYNMTGACPGIWTLTPGDNHTISLHFTGYY